MLGLLTGSSSLMWLTQQTVRYVVILYFAKINKYAGLLRQINKIKWQKTTNNSGYRRNNAGE
jgi:hypothetical protein